MKISGVAFVALFVFSTVISLSGQTKVLFIGNSYVGSNNLPLVFENLALSLGDSLITDRNTPGGYTLQAHSNNAVTLSKIASEDWDFVILQEQSQRPSFPIAQVTADVFPYAEILVDSIHSNSACTEAVFYMTWGRENGDAGNCASWPPVCTYDGMQALLRERYLQMAVDNDAWAAPVGAAWKNIRDTNPAVDLYSADGSHPSFAGTYLAACTFYSTLFGKSTVGASYTGSLPMADAATIQQLASQTVLDSLNLWNIGVNDPFADFTSTYQGAGNWQFSDLSTGQNLSYLWTFDGNSPQTQAAPTVQLNGVDSIEVELIVTDNCGRTDTANAYINPIVAGIEANAALLNAQLFVHEGNIIFQTTNSLSVRIAIYNLNGKLERIVEKRFEPGNHSIGSLAHDVLVYKVTGDVALGGKLIRQ